MFVKSINKITSFTAGDETIIKEVFHPKNDQIESSYSLAHASLDVGASSLPHILKKSSEMYVIVKGNGLVRVGEEERAVEVGDVVLIPAGINQWIENTGTEMLEFYCIVSPPWSEDDELVEGSY
ncbi:MAG: cupin domain-containing protein [Bacteroidota bacterium]